MLKLVEALRFEMVALNILLKMDCGIQKKIEIVDHVICPHPPPPPTAAGG